MRLGIDKIGFWPTTMALDVAVLAQARGRDAAEVRETYLADERAVNAPWEDPVTMAVNAARTALTADDLAGVELLLVASESSVDREKPLSTWVHRHLGLSATCRNLEVKHACYGATGALDMAMAWLSSPLWRGGTVLVINTDHALLCVGQDYEFVTGAGAAAVLVSRDPRVLTIETALTGVHAVEVHDVMRPTSRIETGNGPSSLFSYVDGLEGAWGRYAVHAGHPDLDDHFAGLVFHMPFGSMARTAHRTLLSLNGRTDRSDVAESFARMTLPSLRYNRRMGGTYGASTFIGMLGMLDEGAVDEGDRLGVFAFGAGSCAQFYSGIVEPGARATAAATGSAARLDGRRQLTVEEYEAIERERNDAVGKRDHRPTTAGLQGWYDQYYAGRQLLVLDRVEDYVRRYRWS